MANKWITIGLIVTTITGVVYTTLYYTHQCPKCPEQIDEKYVEEIKEIAKAEDKHAVDSLLHEYYGFKSK